MGQCTSSRSSQIEGILGKRQNSFDNPKSDKKKSKMEKKGGVTRGQAMRFGFKRPPICPGSSQTASTPTAPSLPSVPAQVTRETIEPLVLNPLPRNGTPKLRNKKEVKPINRFGFVPPASLSNKVHDVKAEGQSVGNSPLKLSARSRSETRYNKPAPKNLSSNLSNCNSVGNSNSSINSDMGRGPENIPASKIGKRIPTLVNSNAKSVAADKRAKTVANNQTAKCSLGGQKAKRDDSILEIQQLEHSPSFGHKFRHAHTTQVNQKPRPREMVFNPSPGKRFDLRDLIPMQIADVLESSPQSTNVVQNSVTERIRQEVVLPAARQQEDDKQGEEKQRRDRKDCEKMNKSTVEESTGEEELWAGPGEAMAMDDSMIQSVISDLDHSPETMNAPLRSVLLRIEDPTFAPLAALSNSGLLEDETLPESPDISCSSPSSVDPLPPPPKHLSGSNTPGSPTHGTNSISSDTKERDFLIDDEIADQPGLVFDSAMRDDISLLDTSRTIAKLAEEVSQVLASVDHNGGIDMLKSKKHGSNTSINTLSPCDSLASDDLITDFDISALDDINHSPLRNKKSEILNKSDKVIKEWNALLHSHPGLNSIRTNLKTNKQRVRSTSSGTAESKSNVSTPRRTKQSLPDTEDVSKEVAHLKSTLLMLQRVLQELETGENPEQEEKASAGIQQAAGEPLEVRDLRRQNYLLQLELEENNRQMLKLKEELRIANDRILKQNNKEKIAFSDTASQTDRIRPSTTIFKYSHDSAKPSIVSVNDIQDETQKDHLSRKGRQDNGVHDLTPKTYRSRQEHHSNKILIS